MGLALTSRDTLKVIARLEHRFSEGRLARILQGIANNTDQRREQFNPAVNPNRTLKRVAYKVGIWPGRDRSARPAKRWYKFLHNLEGKAVHPTIRQNLWVALQRPRLKAIKFVAIEGAGENCYLDWITVSGDMIAIITLELLGPLAPGPGASEPPRDPGESPNEPDDPDDSDLEMPVPPFRATKPKPKAKSKAKPKARRAAPKGKRPATRKRK